MRAYSHIIRSYYVLIINKISDNELFISFIMYIKYHEFFSFILFMKIKYFFFNFFLLYIFTIKWKTYAFSF